MRYVLIMFFLVSSELSFAESAINEQFHTSPNEGVTIYNDSFLPGTIYSRFLIPGSDQDAFRNTGTKYTVKPKSDITYYLPAGTQVVATDGIYWDNPAPNYPEERHLVKVVSGKIAKVLAKDFLFRE